MSPIERVRARADAYAELGVAQSADSSEIRAAWRRLAFERHPDRPDGDYKEFVRAKAAYDLLQSDEADADVRHAAWSGARPAHRPRVRSRVVPLSEAAVSACRAALESQTAAAAGRPGETSLAPDRAPDGEAPDCHVPQATLRQGRLLVYLVSTPLVPGLNRVALPTALLKDNRRVEPRVLTVRSAGGGSGEVTLPDHVCARMFPGARGVSIRFGEV